MYHVYSCTTAAIAVIQILNFEVVLKNTSTFMTFSLRSLMERLVYYKYICKEGEIA